MTRLAVPISAETVEQARRQIAAAVSAGAEMVELRTDYLEELTVAGVLELLGDAKHTGLPVIVTCRDKREGGAGEWPEELRSEVLAEAARAGADFVDCELVNFRKRAARTIIEPALKASPSARLILSSHSFDGPFDEPGRIYGDTLAAEPGCIPKTVYTARHINDCFSAFDLLHNAKGDAIVFAMGAAGVISRIVAKKLGSFVTFASVGPEAATAPGQLTVEEFKKLYRYDEINAETLLFGVIGAPVAHSLSPHIHNAGFARAGLNNLYLPLLVEGGREEFGGFMENVLGREWLGFRGFSVTIPHKANALAFVKSRGGYVEPVAEKIGAVNTIIIRPGGRLEAYNTDYAGALDALAEGAGIGRAALKGMQVAVIGAGGVARAIVAGLVDAGARVTIYNRTVDRGRRLAAEFGCDARALDEAVNHRAELLINCTSVGMYPDTERCPVRAECLRGGMTVFDTVYNPPETLLLKQAQAAGAKTVDGLTMFVNQAAAQFRLFTGRQGDSELMRSVAVECFGYAR